MDKQALQLRRDAKVWSREFCVTGREPVSQSLWLFLSLMVRNNTAVCMNFDLQLEMSSCTQMGDFEELRAAKLLGKQTPAATTHLLGFVRERLSGHQHYRNAE